MDNTKGCCKHSVLLNRDLFCVLFMCICAYVGECHIAISTNGD